LAKAIGTAMIAEMRQLVADAILRQTQHPGYVETPGRKRRSRKSGVVTAKDEDSDAVDSSPGLADDTIEIESTPSVRRRKDVKAANGKLNGSANDNVVKHARPLDQVVDGWEPGRDPKVDYSDHFEFGGSWGVSAMMICFPLLMYYMWIGATYYDGKFPTPSDGEGLVAFGKRMSRLVYIGAFPSLKAWAMYWIFFTFEAICYLYLPGVWIKGKPLLHEGGKRLDYYCSGMWSFYTTIAVAAVLHFTGLFKLYEVIDEFGPLLSVAIISGFMVSLAAYFSAVYRGAQHRMTGYPVYDFFMGAELNPRMFNKLDFKMFFEVRLPWYILFLISLGTAARQYEQFGYVSGEVGFLVMAHFLYANACAKGEECIVPTWDMYYEKWGFMLIFWNMAGVPLSYCHCTIFLANHAPKTYQWNRYVLAMLYVTYLFVYWVWDTANSQKNKFRQQERGTDLKRKTFPQLPWQAVENPKTIKTETGDSLLADGWCKLGFPLINSHVVIADFWTDGYARKLHYTCDLFFALSWGLVTGFRSPFPWFYPLFFTGMITHRAVRDNQRCRSKYGKAWEDYERQVPYLFIPVSYTSILSTNLAADQDSSMSSDFDLSSIRGNIMYISANVHIIHKQISKRPP
jgi:delta24(24(1))-sterol reductase